jgi:hypothetical protein
VKPKIHSTVKSIRQLNNQTIKPIDHYSDHPSFFLGGGCHRVRPKGFVGYTRYIWAYRTILNSSQRRWLFCIVSVSGPRAPQTSDMVWTCLRRIAQMHTALQLGGHLKPCGNEKELFLRDWWFNCVMVWRFSVGGLLAFWFHGVKVSWFTGLTV